MMSNQVQYEGARFYKCALQVNSYRYNSDFRGGEPYDENTYNQEILQHCGSNDITVVGLADHGSVEHSKTLRTYLVENKIIVFPGFEIASSEKIHMVCLYSENKTDEDINQFLGQLMGENSSQLRKQPTHPSSLSCEQIAGKVLTEQEGFWYAAHVTGTSGLLRLSGPGDNYVHLWRKDDLVVAVQIPGSLEDMDIDNESLEKYGKILNNQNPDYKRDKSIAIINAKDVYAPEQLSNPSASCRIKMTNANFQAFKDAFKDPQSRIHLNHEIQTKPVSIIESIRWSGAGLFGNQELAFSSNLNAIIGGRGTGKSTLIESIRFVLDLQSRGDDSRKSTQSIQSRNLKNSQVELTVRCGSQHGERYIISRRFGEAPVIKNAGGEISQMTPQDILPEIELLGQNEILEIEQSESSKFALLEKFLPNTHEFSARIDEAKRKLIENRRKIINEQSKFDLTEQKVNREGRLKEQKQQYKNLGIEEKLKNSAFLEKESQIEKRVDDQFNRIEKWINQYDDLFDLNFLQGKNIEVLPNKELIVAIRNIFEQLKTSLDTLVKQAIQGIEKTKSTCQLKQKTWKVESDKIRDQINQAIAKLPDQEGKSGKAIGDSYQKIITELTSLERYKEEYNSQKELIYILNSERRKLLEEYRNAAFERYNAMENEIQKLNKKELQGKIKITISRCKNLMNLKGFMQNLDGIGEAKIKWLDDLEEQIDLIQWSQWISDKSTDKFREKYKDLGLVDSTIDRLIGINLEQRLELEEIQLEDTVSIELNVAHENETKEIFAPMDNLSIGQKCTAILNLLLIKRDDPLIIDQPEDHLDNAFIAERIVSELRNLKTSRQFLLATHNANIPVFGDAELIVVLESKELKAIFKNIGSIDTPETRDQAAQILEGGRAAFDMRKEKYGF